MEERKGKKTIIFEEILLALIPTKNQYFLPIKSTKLLTTPPKICIITFAIKYCAAMAQSVERILGKDEVTGSIPVSSSKKFQVFGLGIFLSIAKAMVYHQPSGCISSTRHSRVVSHHRRCIKLSQ